MSLRTSPFDNTILPQVAVDYVQLFRDLPEPCLLFEASGPDYKIIDINEARENMINVRRADVVGKPLFSIMPYTDVRFRSTAGKNLRRDLQRVVRTGRSHQLEPVSGVVWGANGAKRAAYLQTTYMPLRDANGHLCYILAITREVTDEVHADRRAQTIESRLNAALTIGKVGSWALDVASSKITGDANLMQILKMTEEEAKAYTINDFLALIHKDDRARVRAAVSKSVAENVLFEEECRVRLADGSRRWILVRGEPDSTVANAVFSGVVVDLTEQRNLRAQIELAKEQDRLNRRTARILQQRNEELEVLSRSKDEFVALASHQLRTPATAVKQYVGMLLQGYIGTITSEQADVLQKAFDSNERQLQIIHQILNAARVDTGRLVMAPVPLDLKSLVASLTADMHPIIERRQHTLVVNVPEKPVYVRADLGYLRMAIENVLQNASAYTPKGGHITVTLTADKKTVRLEVTDTGVGIKKADMNQLFIKFARIHNPLSVEAGGSGIGLYLTAEIVHLHGGEVEVKSRPRKGSTFTLLLPVARGDKPLGRGS